MQALRLNDAKISMLSIVSSLKQLAVLRHIYVLVEYNIAFLAQFEVNIVFKACTRIRIDKNNLMY